MPQFLHDEFAKQLLKEVLQDAGTIETNKEVFSEKQESDVFFIPNPEKMAKLIDLGILGKIASKTAIIEPFRNAVNPAQIRSCMVKLYYLYNQLEKGVKSPEQKVKNRELPLLWILTPTASEEILKGFKGEENLEEWGSGIYFLGEHLKTAIVVIHQLPNIPETLWIRILGKGNVQKRAIEQLKALPDNNPHRDNTLKIVSYLMAALSSRQENNEPISQQEQELFMELSTIYEEKIQIATSQGREEGREEGMQHGLTTERRNTIESLLTMKFGAINRELTAIIPNLLTLNPAEFSPLIIQLSKEELIKRFS